MTPFEEHLDYSLNEAGIIAPRGALTKLVAETEDLQNIAHYYSEYTAPNDISLMDTQDRDTLRSVIAHKFLGRDWPINADGDEVMAKFVIAMPKELSKAGWNCNWSNYNA